MSIYYGLLMMYCVANNKNCVIIMFVYFILLDLKEHIWKKILKLEKFTLILCITKNDWNYVRIIIVNVNLLNFRKTVGKKILKFSLFILILCFVGNN